MHRSVLIFFVTVALAKTAFGDPTCVGLAAPSDLPTELPVVVLNTSFYIDQRVVSSKITNTVYAPGVELNSNRAQMMNLNDVWFPNSTWKKFVIGDGSVRRSFNSLDLRSGSLLSVWVEKFLENFIKYHPVFQNEDLIRSLASDFSSDQYLKWTENAYLGDGRSELPWDMNIQVDPELWKDFQAMLGRPVSLNWWTTRQQRFPVVPLEKYLNSKIAYCMQRALIVSAILSARGISHRLVNGLLDEGPGKTGGHTWIQLADGRILDPSMNLLAHPKRDHPTNPHWLLIGVGYRFESQIYPALLFP